MYNFDVKKVKEELIKWIQEWFKENGDGCNAVIGISGGKDSTVTAALMVEALGKERVVGVLMPNGVQADIGDSKKVVELLSDKLDIKGYRLVQNNGSIQDVKHYHLHIIPIHKSKKGKLSVEDVFNLLTK